MDSPVEFLVIEVSIVHFDGLLANDSLETIFEPVDARVAGVVFVVNDIAYGGFESQFVFEFAH